MAAQVQLVPVKREDVARVASWLEDPDVCESWFGRYTYGDPAHLGYEPLEMINATEAEWTRCSTIPITSRTGTSFRYTRCQASMWGKGNCP